MKTFMKKLNARALVRNALVIMAIVLVTIFATNLNNPLMDGPDFAGAFEAVADPFGGWLNLIATLGEFALGVVGTYMLWRAFIKENDTQDAVLYTVIVLFVLALAAVIGFNWIVFPSGAGIMSLIVIAVIVGGALSMRSPFKTAEIKPAEAVESNDFDEFPLTHEHQFNLGSPYNNTNASTLKSV